MFLHILVVKNANLTKVKKIKYINWLDLVYFRSKIELKNTRNPDIFVLNTNYIIISTMFKYT